MSDNNDLALEALLYVRREVAPMLDENLLRECYAIQRRYQFSEDSVQSSIEMERLIDDAVASIVREA